GIMDMVKQIIAGIRLMSERHWKNGQLCGAFCLMAPMDADAYGQAVGRRTYIFYQHASSPVYDIALKVMDPTYKGKIGPTNPLIGVAEVDLNGDNLLEIISKPTEEYEQEGEFCRANNVCPHYITQID